MTQVNEDNQGIVKISEDVIAACVQEAVRKTAGVYSLISNLPMNLLNKDPLYKGIRISQNDEGISADVYILVDYGVKIPAVAWDLQENVKEEIEAMVDIPVKTVNIHVQGVGFNQEEE